MSNISDGNWLTLWCYVRLCQADINLDNLPSRSLPNDNRVAHDGDNGVDRRYRGNRASQVQSAGTIFVRLEEYGQGFLIVQDSGAGYPRTGMGSKIIQLLMQPDRQNRSRAGKFRLSLSDRPGDYSLYSRDPDRILPHTRFA